MRKTSPVSSHQHVSRLQRYLERYHSYLDAPLRHVYLAGNGDAVARAQQKFAELSEFEVHVLEPADIDMPWNHAAEVPGTDLAAALGTAMVLYSESSEEPGPNLIETALALHREPMRPILVRSLIPIAAVVLVAATLFLLQLKQWHETSAIQAEVDNLAPACARATELRLNLASAEHKLDGAAGARETTASARMAANLRPHQPKHAGRRLAGSPVDPRWHRRIPCRC